MPRAIGAISDAAAACDVLQTNRQQQAQPGQVSEVSNHELSGPSSGRKAVMYAPFVSKDVIKQSLSKNLVRNLNGKSWRPLVAQDDVAQAQLQQLKQEYQGSLRNQAMAMLNEIEQLQFGASEEELCEFLGVENLDDMIRACGEAIRQADLLSNLEVRSNKDGLELFDLTPENSKLYIVGHGGAGLDILAADSAATVKVSVAELAEQLAAGGLNRDFRDFRVTACYSADARAPTSFQQEELRNAAAPTQGKQPGFLGLFRRPLVPRQPLAQSLSNALSERGFSQPEVSGYHGIGVIFSKIGHHNMRDIPDSGLPRVRASEVRQMFKPTNE
ncbi:hypothetical protein [Burkholderia pyrrocinia]